MNGTFKDWLFAAIAVVAGLGFGAALDHSIRYHDGAIDAAPSAKPFVVGGTFGPSPEFAYRPDRSVISKCGVLLVGQLCDKDNTINFNGHLETAIVPYSVTVTPKPSYMRLKVDAKGRVEKPR